MCLFFSRSLTWRSRPLWTSTQVSMTVLLPCAAAIFPSCISRLNNDHKMICYLFFFRMTWPLRSTCPVDVLALHRLLRYLQKKIDDSFFTGRDHKASERQSFNQMTTLLAYLGRPMIIDSCISSPMPATEFEQSTGKTQMREQDVVEHLLAIGFEESEEYLDILFHCSSMKSEWNELCDQWIDPVLHPLQPFQIVIDVEHIRILHHFLCVIAISVHTKYSLFDVRSIKQFLSNFSEFFPLCSMKKCLLAQRTFNVLLPPMTRQWDITRNNLEFKIVQHFVTIDCLSTDTDAHEGDK